MAKKRLTQDQEFQIMKLVLDKFLWIGLGVMIVGFVRLVQEQIADGIAWIVAGAFILVLFMILIVKHYEIA